MLSWFLVVEFGCVQGGEEDEIRVAGSMTSVGGVVACHGIETLPVVVRRAVLAIRSEKKGIGKKNLRKDTRTPAGARDHYIFIASPPGRVLRKFRFIVQLSD